MIRGMQKMNAVRKFWSYAKEIVLHYIIIICMSKVSFSQTVYAWKFHSNQR
jgi:hypothetical protein